jgi:hypothetical protein
MGVKAVVMMMMMMTTTTVCSLCIFVCFTFQIVGGEILFRFQVAVFHIKSEHNHGRVFPSRQIALEIV